jgi:AcrR family transcriptional regulator
VTSKQEKRSEETKKSIVAAAQRLFAEQGYDTVTMREIAKEAGCSHTTIYIYFKDKVALLNQLAMPSLLQLKQLMEEAVMAEVESSDNKIKAVSLAFIRFCLNHRNMYEIIFNTKSSRVDQKEPELEINQQRVELFGLLMSALQGSFPTAPSQEQLLLYSRIYYFTLQGIVATYAHSEESAETLMDRLAYTFNEAFEVLLCGFKQKEKN